LANAKQKARTVGCLSNLRQIGVAITLYAGDHEDELVPVELDKRNGAPFQEGWPTLLVKANCASAEWAPSFYAISSRPSIFQCPSGLPEVYMFGPTSRDDSQGATAWPFASETPGKTRYIHCWYGINGSAGRPKRWPFTRIPMDLSGSTTPNRFSIAAQQPRMPTVYDGFWMHNGKDERINARHNRNTRSNVLFFDASASSFDTYQLPAVNDKSSGAVRWRF
jgi:prepilin-type processing-associated H-X9-DG protein